MKFQAKGLSTSQMIMAVIGIVVFIVGFGLVITWALLSIWNWFAAAAGWGATIPVNFATVFGAWIMFVLLKTILSKQKD